VWDLSLPSMRTPGFTPPCLFLWEALESGALSPIVPQPLSPPVFKHRPWCRRCSATSLPDPTYQRHGQCHNAHLLPPFSINDTETAVKASRLGPLVSAARQAPGDAPKALLSSVQLSHTGDFLNVVPSGKLGLKLDSVEFQLAFQYRLGRPVYPSDGMCPLCGQDSNLFGDHAISSCGHYGERTRQHDDLRDVLYPTAQAGGLAPMKEERHLLDLPR
jgi:hypothetical protein